MSDNKQKIQGSIAQTSRPQTEAMGKKRNAKATQSNKRTSNPRRRRNFRNAGEPQVSNDNEDKDDNDGGKGSSSDDEQPETNMKRCTRGGETQFPQHSDIADADGAGEENISELNREIMSSYDTLGMSTSNGGINKMIDHLFHSDSEVNDDELDLDIHVMLASSDELKIPNLQQPYLCCKPTLSVRKLREYVALKTELQANQIELFVVKEPEAAILRAQRPVYPKKDRLRVLEEHETLAELNTPIDVSCGHLLMVYDKKLEEETMHEEGSTSVQEDKTPIVEENDMSTMQRRRSTRMRGAPYWSREFSMGMRKRRGRW